MNDEPHFDSTQQRNRLEKSLHLVPIDRVKNTVSTTAAGEARRPASEPTPVSRVEYQAVKGQLHQRLLDEMNRLNLLAGPDGALSEAVREFVDRVLLEEDQPLNDAERKSLADDLLEETLGVGPLATLMVDPAVTDILVNRFDQVYIERFGRLEKTNVRFRDNDHLVRIIQRIAARIGRRVDDSSPMVDARLLDGSRVNATVPPVTIDGPTLSIRRFGVRRLRCDELLRLKMFSPAILQFLQAAIVARKNILISGGTGSGKTTFLGAMAEAIPDHERIVTIEDAAELVLDQEHVVRMETRPANIEGRGRIVARDLVINALRMRPDRIVVGEVRGPEALDMLQAMNTGHDGSLTTVHSNSPRDALARLETMVLTAGVDLPSRAIREQMVSALHLVVQVRRYEDGARRVESIAEITGIEGLTPQLQDIFRFERRGKTPRAVQGEFVSTGIVPRIIEELRDRGINVPLSLFSEGVGVTVMGVSISLAVFLLGSATVVYLYRDLRIRRLAADRLMAELPEHDPNEDFADAATRLRPFARRHYVLPWLAAVALLAIARQAVGLPMTFAAAFAFVIGLLLQQLDAMLLARQTDRIENQLADAIDLMISSLKVGAALQSSLESAVRDTRAPLRPQLEELLGRIRLGDDPRTTLAALAARVPLETFHLFSMALAVHWDVGGSLTQTLATVGRTIRNRIEISRRLQSLTTQSRTSIVAIMLTSYFIAALIWRNNPERMYEFLITNVGQWLTAAAIVLQGVGIVWISRLSKARF